MNLSGIVAVSGKPGLWKALAQTKTGFILESLDAQKLKLVVNVSTAKLAALDEITVFGNMDDIKLTEILERIKAAPNVPDAKADGKALRTFFFEVAPDHDEEKVYSSDIKKIISWFHILKDMPIFNEAPQAAATTEEASAEKPAVKVTDKPKEKKQNTATKAPKASAPKAASVKNPSKKG